MSASSTDRLAQLAALYVKHDAQLLSVVGRRVAAQPATVADACSHAWAQLLAAERIDLTLPRGPLAWLTTTAVREAWRLNELEWRATPLSHDDLDAIANTDSTRPSTDQLADLHDCLDLIDELPERRRRFLLRQAIGYSYNEIAAAEGVSYTATCRLIADAKRRLRELDRARGANNCRSALQQAWTPSRSPTTAAPSPSPAASGSGSPPTSKRSPTATRADVTSASWPCTPATSSPATRPGPTPTATQTTSPAWSPTRTDVTLSRRSRQRPAATVAPRRDAGVVSHRPACHRCLAVEREAGAAGNAIR